MWVMRWVFSRDYRIRRRIWLDRKKTPFPVRRLYYAILGWPDIYERRGIEKEIKEIA